MTREEIEQKATEYGIDGWSTWNLIEEILSDFESRICENCKYRLTNHAKDMFWCINEDGANKYRTMDIRVDLDFGCNEWEAKDD